MLPRNTGGVIQKRSNLKCSNLSAIQLSLVNRVWAQLWEHHSCCTQRPWPLLMVPKQCSFSNCRVCEVSPRLIVKNFIFPDSTPQNSDSTDPQCSAQNCAFGKNTRLFWGSVLFTTHGASLLQSLRSFMILLPSGLRKSRYATVLADKTLWRNFLQNTGQTWSMCAWEDAHWAVADPNPSPHKHNLGT